MEDLKELITCALDQKGVLSRLKAELRANVFLAVDEQDKRQGDGGISARGDASRRAALASSREGALLLDLVHELLAWADLRFTSSVFEAEARRDGVQLQRRWLAAELGLPGQEVDDQPLLLQLLLLQAGKRGDGIPWPQQAPLEGRPGEDQAEGRSGAAGRGGASEGDEPPGLGTPAPLAAPKLPVAGLAVDRRVPGAAAACKPPGASAGGAGASAGGAGLSGGGADFMPLLALAEASPRSEDCGSSDEGAADECGYESGHGEEDSVPAPHACSKAGSQGRGSGELDSIEVGQLGWPHHQRLQKSGSDNEQEQAGGWRRGGPIPQPVGAIGVPELAGAGGLQAALSGLGGHQATGLMELLTGSPGGGAAGLAMAGVDSGAGMAPPFSPPGSEGAGIEHSANDPQSPGIRSQGSWDGSGSNSPRQRHLPVHLVPLPPARRLAPLPAATHQSPPLAAGQGEGSPAAVSAASSPPPLPRAFASVAVAQGSAPAACQTPGRSASAGLRPEPWSPGSSCEQGWQLSEQQATQERPLLQQQQQQHHQQQRPGGGAVLVEHIIGATSDDHAGSSGDDDGALPEDLPSGGEVQGEESSLLFTVLRHPPPGTAGGAGASPVRGGPAEAAPLGAGASPGSSSASAGGGGCCGGKGMGSPGSDSGSEYLAEALRLGRGAPPPPRHGGGAHAPAGGDDADDEDDF